MTPIQKTRAVLAEAFQRKPTRALSRTQQEGLARHWGRFCLSVVIRHMSSVPVFVHCHECRWPVSPGRTHMATGAGFYANGSNALPATEEQMGRICDGVRQHMGAV